MVSILGILLFGIEGSTVLNIPIGKSVQNTQIISNLREIQQEAKITPGIKPKASQRLVQSNFPTRIKIPRIHVDADIESVGLIEGSIGSPKKIKNAAWYRLGPIPGEVGNAIIDGHFGWIKGEGAIFNNLHTLKKGDLLYITNNKAVVTTFVLREIRTYREDAIVADIFHSTDGKSHLNIITCQGVWNKSKKRYTDRLVVLTDKVE